MRFEYVSVSGSNFLATLQSNTSNVVVGKETSSLVVQFEVSEGHKYRVNTSQYVQVEKLSYEDVRTGAGVKDRQGRFWKSVTNLKCGDIIATAAGHPERCFRVVKHRTQVLKEPLELNVVAFEGPSLSIGPVTFSTSQDLLS